jgi:hypothetical protein
MYQFLTNKINNVYDLSNEEINEKNENLIIFKNKSDNILLMKKRKNLY